MSEIGNAAPATPELPGTAADEADLWAFEAEDDLTTYVYRESESAEVRDARVNTLRRGYVCQILGPISPEIVKQTCGGGVYRLTIKRGRNAVTTRRLTVAGPPKDVGVQDTPAAAAAPAASAALDLGAIERLIEATITRLVPQRAQADPLELALKMLERMNPPAPAAVDTSVIVNGQMDMLKRGIEIARREGGEGRTVGDAFIEALPQLVETVDKIVTARAMATPPGAPPAGARPQGQVSAVQLALANMVARALKNNTEIPDFADTLEVLLTPTELGDLKKLSPVMISGMLRSFAPTFPELGEDRMPAYVEAVHVALVTSVDSEHENGDGETDSDDEPPPQ